MYNKEQESVSVIGVERRTTSDSPVARRRRVSAREARRRKKRKKMIRLYTRLAILISVAGLVLFLGISLISMGFSALSDALGGNGKKTNQTVDVVGNNMPGVSAKPGSDASDSNSSGGESSDGHIYDDTQNNTGQDDPIQDDPIELMYGDDLYNDGEFVVCIDPGHGGNDVGCVGIDNTYEKNDVLKLAGYLVHLLEKAGVKVVQTRSTDVWVNLEDRPAFANENNADLLVSLHRNIYSEDENVRGFEAWINSEDADNSEELAKLIMGGLVDAGISKNRGVKKGSQASEKENYAVNLGSKMPSVLLEMGFMSSPTDNQLFRDNLQEYAQAIADAIIQWSQGKQY